MLMLNISVAFPGKPIESEEFLNQVIGTLGITITYRRAKGRPRK